MNKPIRSHLSIMYDELWAEHIRLSSGKTVKPFKDRCNFSWTNPEKELSKGFIIEKPDEFYKIDTIFPRNNQENYLIHLADNRMMMGDYRYGSIRRQNLDNYDVVSEFFRRIKIAKETTNLEYLVDAYNMLRIQYFKKKNIVEIKHLLKHHLYILLEQASKESWELISIDDGIHAEEK